MILKRIQSRIEKLQQTNYKSFYLAFLRIAISIWLLKEVCINWSSMDMLYGHSAFIVPENNIIRRFSEDYLIVKDYYVWFIFFYSVIIVFNMLGIGRRVTAVLLFINLYLLQKMNWSIFNGGDLMARLIVFYLIFADSYQYFVLFKNKNKARQLRKLTNLVSNLAALSIMLQLCIAYFSTGLGKLNTDLWKSGEAVYYAMLNERFMGTPYNRWLVQHKWIDYTANYATLVFELGFPFLIWFKKLRPTLLITGIIFHLGIYIFLMIYGFQIVFLLIYGLFLPNDLLLKYAGKVNTFFGGGQGALSRYIGLSDEPIPVSR